MQKVEDLIVFKKAHKITLELYKKTASFPKEEKYGVIGQLRRAAASINANLLEGSSRISTKEYRQFVGIARGSAGELKYHLMLVRDLSYILISEYESYICEVEEICKMLTGLIKKLENKYVKHKIKDTVTSTDTFTATQMRCDNE